MVLQSIKSFFKQVFAVVIGIFICLVLLVGMLMLLLQPSKPKIADKTVLHLVLRGELVEYAPNRLRQFFKGSQEEVIELIALKEAIKCAQEDKNIQGIYLEVGTLKAGWAGLEEIREALLSFKEAGKFIVAYGESYTQKTYYLASLADDIVLHPEGIFPLVGLSQTVFFYKTLLDRLEIVPQVFRHGKYKSAVEPFTRQDMSQASKHQSTVLLHAIYNHFLDKIAVARAVNQESIRAMADTLSIVTPQDAWRARLVSQVGYFDDVEALIKARLTLDAAASIHYISLEGYTSRKRPAQSSKSQVAILVAEGVMVDGKGTSGVIGAKDLAADLKALREDPNVSAVVLRINSPGGSALAADVLWRELSLTKAQKPVVASISDMAASGGYYLAAACSRILAHPTSITGSIGIFGLFFDVNALLRNKLGIATDVVKTSSSADLFSNPGRPLTTHEKAVIQGVVDKGYNTFLERVASGRNLDKQVVARVASGRVWSGLMAQEKGLVDELGGFENAIQVAAKLAAVEDSYTVAYWPRPQSLPEQVLSSLKNHVSLGKEVDLKMLKVSYPSLKAMQELINMTGIQARLPYTVEID